jgi:hypothetical protein
MFDFLRTAGSALVGPDKIAFGMFCIAPTLDRNLFAPHLTSMFLCNNPVDHIKELFDNATTDLLIGPDWAANMAAVDALVTVTSPIV